MIVRGRDGLTFERTPGQLAAAFWASPWGRLLADPLEPFHEATRPLLAWLTASVQLGGLEASWDDPEGLRELLDKINDSWPQIERYSLTDYKVP